MPVIPVPLQHLCCSAQVQVSPHLEGRNSRPAKFPISLPPAMFVACESDRVISVQNLWRDWILEDTKELLLSIFGGGGVVDF